MRKKNPFPKYIRYECYLLQFFFSLKAAKPIDTALSKTSFHQFSKEIETTAPGPQEPGGRGGHFPPLPGFARLVNPISTRWADYAKYLILRAPPYFQTSRLALMLHFFQSAFEVLCSLRDLCHSTHSTVSSNWNSVFIIPPKNVFSLKLPSTI